MAIDWEKAMRDAVRSAYAGKGGIFFESNPSRDDPIDWVKRNAKPERPKWHIDGDIEFREDEEFWDEYDMKDVTPHTEPPPTPKPRQRTVQLHQNTIAGKGCYEIMMPNGVYLGGADGLPYLLRFKGGLDNEARRELTVEKFQKVYDNFKRLWP